MRKIPSVWKRNYDGDRLVRDEVTPGCEWVLAGEGQATVKLDGTACAVIRGLLYRRYDAKPGRSVPEGAIACEPERDPSTGHWPHWVPVGDGPEDAPFREAYAGREQDGTYELLGPKVQGNVYRLSTHTLQRHGAMVAGLVPVTFNEMREYMRVASIEGVVWHHPDGRMAKIKRRDFGFAWPPKRIEIREIIEISVVKDPSNPQARIQDV